MTEKATSFRILTDKVIAQLESLGYKDNTIINYRRSYNRIATYLEERGYTEYDPAIGEEYLETLSYLNKISYGFHKCVIRRLNDYIRGKEYTYAQKMDGYPIVEEYRHIQELFIKEYRDKGNKEWTIQCKERVTSSFLNFIFNAGCKRISDISPELINKALAEFQNEDSYAIIRMFLRYVFDNGLITNDLSSVIPTYRWIKKLPSVYTPAEIKRIEEAIDIHTIKGRRDLPMLRLITRMGIRVGDVAKLKWGELDLEHGKLAIIQQKTGTPLMLDMPDDVLSAFKLYLENNTYKNDDYVFYPLKGPKRRITTTLVGHALHSYIEKSNINVAGRKYGPHAFRASLASSMVNDDVSYEVVRKILGHTDPNVIMRYARTDIEKLRQCAITPPEPTGLFKDLLNGRRVIKNV